ncbi:MAG: hypothetical protein Q9167_005293 [Letrouitia subvulpina]
MSQSPATPNKFGAGLDKATLSSPSASKPKQYSINEPSPASTYGDTAQGDSVPATPQDVRDRDSTSTLIASLSAAQLDDSAERNPRSSFSGPESKFTLSDQPSEVQRTRVCNAPEYQLSPSQKHRGRSSSSTSPTVDRYNNSKNSPSWCAGEGFVRLSEVSTDDPFVTGGSTNQSSNADHYFQPREDRAGLALSGDTAQAVLPPNACVFVANLTQSKSDDQLEYSVSTVFQAFGNVYVKIRRDGKGMPFAFCQYEITGGRISETEAHQVLARFGALEKVWYCSQTDKEMFRLPEGIWVMFAFFQDCRDAQAGFRDDPIYRLEQPKMPEDIRTRLGSQSHSSSMSHFNRYSPKNGLNSPQATIRRAADRCSIFVGNLPTDATDEKLQELFGVYGRIIHIELLRKPSINASGVNTFAFIEYRSQEEAEYATRLIYELGGNRLRVERKESLEFVGRRDMSSFTGGSPRNHMFTDSPEAMALLFQRGVSVGMANAAASQTHTLSPSVYAPYQLYQPLTTQYGSFTAPASQLDNEPQNSLPVQGNQYLPHSISPALSQAMPPAVQTYSAFQLPSLPPGSSQYIQHPHWHQRTSNYQWPPIAPGGGSSNATSATRKDETQQ